MSAFTILRSWVCMSSSVRAASSSADDALSNLSSTALLSFNLLSLCEWLFILKDGQTEITMRPKIHAARSAWLCYIQSAMPQIFLVLTWVCLQWCTERVAIYPSCLRHSRSSLDSLNLIFRCFRGVLWIFALLVGFLTFHSCHLWLAASRSEIFLSERSANYSRIESPSAHYKVAQVEI